MNYQRKFILDGNLGENNCIVKDTVVKYIIEINKKCQSYVINVYTWPYLHCFLL